MDALLKPPTGPGRCPWCRGRPRRRDAAGSLRVRPVRTHRGRWPDRCGRRPVGGLGGCRSGSAVGGAGVPSWACAARFRPAVRCRVSSGRGCGRGCLRGHAYGRFPPGALVDTSWPASAGGPWRAVAAQGQALSSGSCWARVAWHRPPVWRSGWGATGGARGKYPPPALRCVPSARGPGGLGRPHPSAVGGSGETPCTRPRSLTRPDPEDRRKGPGQRGASMAMRCRVAPADGAEADAALRAGGRTVLRARVSSALRGGESRRWPGDGRRRSRRSVRVAQRQVGAPRLRELARPGSHQWCRRPSGSAAGRIPGCPGWARPRCTRGRVPPVARWVMRGLRAGHGGGFTARRAGPGRCSCGHRSGRPVPWAPWTAGTRRWRGDPVGVSGRPAPALPRPLGWRRGGRAGWCPHGPVGLCRPVAHGGSGRPPGLRRDGPVAP